MLHTKHNIDAFFFRGGRLFQQYLVDPWAACDQNKCDWTRTHQANLGADLYNGLVDSMAREDGNAANLGRKIILPSSFVGGDRWIMQLYQNSMAIIQHLGRTSLFVTFTTNPKWEEIEKELYPGQKAMDRSDLIARVFHLKKQELLH